LRRINSSLKKRVARMDVDNRKIKRFDLIPDQLAGNSISDPCDMPFEWHVEFFVSLAGPRTALPRWTRYLRLHAIRLS